MTQQTIAAQTCAGAFNTVAQADQAIRRLLAARFTKEQLAVICPAKFKEHFQLDIPQAESPTADVGDAIASGGVLGATLGGLALAATALTGGAVGVMTGAVLIGGGALAGGFSNLIVSKGYEQEADDHSKKAIERGQIVVGVEANGEDAENQLANAQRILDETGAERLFPD